MKCITFVCDEKTATAFNKLEESMEEVSQAIGLPYQRQHCFAGQYVQMRPEDFYNFWTLYGAEITNENQETSKKA